MCELGEVRGGHALSFCVSPPACADAGAPTATHMATPTPCVLRVLPTAPEAAAAAAAAASSPAQQQQRRRPQHTSSPVLGPIVLVPMVVQPPATVRMGGTEFPAGQQGPARAAAAAGAPRHAAAVAASPGSAAKRTPPRPSLRWCHPAAAGPDALPERDHTAPFPMSPAAAAGAGRSPARPRGTVSWCQPAKGSPTAHR